MYGWGSAACGQLGPDSNKALPKDSEGSPYQPEPTLIAALNGKRVVAVSCGEAHTLVLDENGMVYSFGANGCGQLGQDLPGRYENSPNAKATPMKLERHVVEPVRVIEGRRHGAAEESQHLTINLQNLRNSRRNASAAFEIYPMHKEELSISHYYSTPNLVRYLVSNNVLKISSGGVHNLAIVETINNSLQPAIYTVFMTGQHTDFVFVVEGVSVKVHKVILAYKSSYFAAFFTSKKDVREVELKGTRYRPFRLVMEYIYLADLALMDMEGFDRELIDTYKLASKYGLNSLQEEIKRRLRTKLKSITVDDYKEGKKKCKAANVMESLAELAKKYEAIINDVYTEEHKVVMLPNGSALIIDSDKYVELLESGIQVAPPEQSPSQHRSSALDGQPQLTLHKGANLNLEESKTFSESGDAQAEDVL